MTDRKYLVEMLAVEGLNDAAVGTAVRDGRELLVYDAYKAMEIAGIPPDQESGLLLYLDELGLEELGADAPIFIFLDDGISKELNRSDRGHLSLVH